MSSSNFVLIKENKNGAYEVSENCYDTDQKMKIIGTFDILKNAIGEAEKYIDQSEFGVEYGIRFIFDKSEQKKVETKEIFNEWNEKKKKISEKNRVYFQKGDVWVMSMGKNIGDEEDGKHSDFERPILIVRKFNNNVFLGIPLTTNQNKDGDYYHKLTSLQGSSLILSQIRLFDAKRLLRYIGKVENAELREIKLKIGKIV